MGGKVEVRLGSVEGKKIGESAFLEPGGKMDFTPQVLTIPVNLNNVSTDKLQDIYLVFVNPKSANQSLMVVMGAEFKMYNEGEVPEIVESKPPADFFAGKWATTILGTPQGDAEMLMEFTRTGDKLQGLITAKGQNEETAIDKIEETAESIKLFFKMAGFDLNVTLTKEDNDNLSGKMMGMFQTVAKRVN